MARQRSDRVLLVEGRDDREVIYQFCNYHGIDNRELFSVQDKTGITELVEAFRVQLRSGVEVLAVVVDADDDLQARWSQIRGHAASFGYILPKTPSATGTIGEPPAPNRPRLGIWVMPDNSTTGMLEDFLIRLIDSNCPLHVQAAAAVADISETDRAFGPTKTSKAVLHTWLAWQEEPGTPMGQAITKRYLDPALNPAPDFLAWLRELFVPVAP